MPIEIQSSVGLNGVNRPDDVLAVKTRLVELGFNFITGDGVMGPVTIKTIRLFQAIKNGLNVVSDPRNDGRVDVGGDTLRWLQAANAPRWQRMPAGSAAEGFVNDNIADLSDNHDFGTSWMAETLRATGLTYRSAFLGAHPHAALLHINDTSLPQGGGHAGARDARVGSRLRHPAPAQGWDGRRHHGEFGRLRPRLDARHDRGLPPAAAVQPRLPERPGARRRGALSRTPGSPQPRAL